MNEPLYYKPPENHESHVKKMVVWLLAFFVTLLLVVVLIITFADVLARKLPFTAEKRFVRPYEAIADYFFDEEPSEHEVRVKAYLNDLSAKLMVHMEIPEEYIIDVHYIDSGTVNAFATLGGHVFVFRGLIEAMPDENSLSMILAHEIAHIKHRDPLAAMSRGFALQMIYGFAVGDYSAGSEIMLDGSEIGLMYFGREQEQQADLQAINGIYGHYGHAQGYDSLFTYIIEEMDEEKSEDGSVDWQEWLSTHPKLEKRIELLGEYAGQNNMRIRGVIKEIPDEIRESIREIKKENKRKQREKDKA